MKTRESGMPADEQWEAYSQPKTVLDRLALQREAGHVVEFGCGFGTFTIPAAKRAHGTVYAFDIDPQMVERVKLRTELAALGNVVCELRDFDHAARSGHGDASTPPTMPGLGIGDGFSSSLGRCY